MKRRGYILVEVLVASMLISIAGAGLYSGFSKAMTLTSRVHETDALYDPLKILYFRVSKDLRNMVSLREYPFTGKQDEMVFPSAITDGQMTQVRYFVKDKALMRSEESLPPGFVKKEPAAKPIFLNLKDVRFEYVYLDEEDNLIFKPIWIEEPYFGIPKAVRVQIKTEKGDHVFLRLFSVPQGRFGHVVEAV